VEKPNLNFSILGAGIGGLTLALALKRRGIDAAVYERASSISEIGAGLLLSPNAVSILYAIGLKEELPAISVETPEWRVLDSKGAILSKIRPQMGQIPGISLRRSDLQQLLVHRLEPNRIHLGCDAIQISKESGGRPFIGFANGKHVSSDLVAAADGIHSQIRNSFFQETVKRPSHYVGWRAMVDFVPRGWENGMVTETWARGMRGASSGEGLSPSDCFWRPQAGW